MGRTPTLAASEKARTAPGVFLCRAHAPHGRHAPSGFDALKPPDGVKLSFRRNGTSFCEGGRRGLIDWFHTRRMRSLSTNRTSSSIRSLGSSPQRSSNCFLRKQRATGNQAPTTFSWGRDSSRPRTGKRPRIESGKRHVRRFGNVPFNDTKLFTLARVIPLVQKAFEGCKGWEREGGHEGGSQPPSPSLAKRRAIVSERFAKRQGA
jgi:hypothetical protein